MSMSHPLSTLVPRILLASLLYCLPCTSALAESQLEFEEAETEAADDENVEDIESSKPLRKNIDKARKISHPDQTGASEAPESSPKTTKIAPHIDLKELAARGSILFPGDGSQRDHRAKTRARAKNRNGNNTRSPPRRGYTNCTQ